MFPEVRINPSEALPLHFGGGAFVGAGAGFCANADVAKSSEQIVLVIVRSFIRGVNDRRDRVAPCHDSILNPSYLDFARIGYPDLPNVSRM